MYKGKTFYSLTKQKVDEKRKIVEMEAENKVIVKEPPFVKVYYQNCNKKKGLGYKDIVLLLNLAERLEEHNIIDLGALSRKKVRNNLGISESAVSVSIAKLHELGYLLKVINNETYTVMKGVYMVSPEIMTQTIGYGVVALQDYIEKNNSVLKEKYHVIMPTKTNNKLIFNISDIPDELLSEFGLNTKYIGKEKPNTNEEVQ